MQPFPTPETADPDDARTVELVAIALLSLRAEHGARSWAVVWFLARWIPFIAAAAGIDPYGDR